MRQEDVDAAHTEMTCCDVLAHTAAVARLQRLTDSDWEAVLRTFPPSILAAALRGRAVRDFVEAVLWVVDTGGHWIDMPIENGKWHNAYVRFARWASEGVWTGVIDALSFNPALQSKLRVRVHQYLCASSLRKARRRHRAGCYTSTD